MRLEETLIKDLVVGDVINIGGGTDPGGTDPWSDAIVETTGTRTVTVVRPHMSTEMYGAPAPGQASTRFERWQLLVVDSRPVKVYRYRRGGF